MLKYYNRPAGKVAVKESISVSNKITVSAGIKIKYVEAALGITYEETSTIAVDWENKFDFPVRIEIYPTYEIKNGELWEEDVFFDDYYGTFEYWRAVGDDLRVYKNN